MKRIIAILLVCMLLGSSAAFAAEWPAGRSPSQPYSGSPPVDLTKTMGYIILFPRVKLPARTFCDMLQVFMPREDVELGSGTVCLMQMVDGKPVEVCSTEVSGPGQASVRRMTEQELSALMWGSGVCVEIRLPKSLEFDVDNYFVTMEEGCFTAANGRLPSLTIAKPEAWNPVLQGDYGIGGLYYSEGAPEPEHVAEAEEADEAEETTGDDIEFIDEAEAEEEAEAEPEPTQEPQPEEDPVIKAVPEAGDRIDFDLVMGGGVAYAVIYSENGSVDFAELEYTQSGHVIGKVIRNDVSWGVVFLDADGKIVENLDLTR